MATTPAVPAEKPRVATAGPAAGPAPPRREGRRRSYLIAALFLVPALVVLLALVVYPIGFSMGRSFYDKLGENFVGVENYGKIFTSSTTFTAIRNTTLWVLVAPAVVTALGLIFAVLTERVRWSTAFKVAVFMPMAISFLSAGVIWRLVYEGDPSRGLLNAGVGGVIDVFRAPGPYPGARPSDEEALVPEGSDRNGFITTESFSPGDTATLGLVAVAPDLIPEDSKPAQRAPQAGANTLAGVVWLDFTRGGGGEPGVVDPTEVGLPGVTVEALADGAVAASAVTAGDGSFLLEGLEQGNYKLRLAESTFREAFGGFTWLGPSLITPAVMVAFIWIWAGFAMVIIGAGLAAIPRETLEAARVDGASEWQVFRRVTVPLLAPVLGVVLVTLIINVLKIFDLVFVIAPGGSVRSANVIALEIWRAAFGGANDFGLGSALAVLLLLLVVPFMILNVRRFRAEQ
jgi:alpha-glucoside transport system permease protein